MRYVRHWRIFKEMDEKSFAELIASLKEGMEILRGEKEPSRTIQVDAPDVKAIGSSH